MFQEYVPPCSLINYPRIRQNTNLVLVMSDSNDTNGRAETTYPFGIVKFTFDFGSVELLSS